GWNAEGFSRHGAPPAIDRTCAPCAGWTSVWKYSAYDGAFDSTCICRRHLLEYRNPAPGGSPEAVRVIGAGIHNRCSATDDIGDQMAGARANAESVAAESCRENQAGHTGRLADAWHAVRGAVDITGPGRGDFALFQRRDQFQRALVSQAHDRFVNRWIKGAHPLHWRRLIQPPAGHSFMARPYAFQSAWRKVAPAALKHGQKLCGEAQQLRRGIHSSATT